MPDGGGAFQTMKKKADRILSAGAAISKKKGNKTVAKRGGKEPHLNTSIRKDQD